MHWYNVHFMHLPCRFVQYNINGSTKINARGNFDIWNIKKWCLTKLISIYLSICLNVWWFKISYIVSRMYSMGMKHIIYSGQIYVHKGLPTNIHTCMQIYSFRHSDNHVPGICLRYLLKNMIANFLSSSFSLPLTCPSQPVPRVLKCLFFL
jgi:hypothetical protein